ncbi:T9SS type A sorting domain-containing protein [uncultured Planktosalinus sp.]|uniref:T9SS type A sorting domain-containing protein n=1 Tax=uncultured Planktosalinus sp. TaxID=1810935 RepID=UPI0030D6D081
MKTHPFKILFVGFAVLITGFVSPLFSQDILWEKSYGGLHAEYLFDAQPTADYGFILAGSSISGKSGNKLDERISGLDYWVWKMDEKGDMEWQKSFGGNGNDFLKSIQGTRDGGFILGGNSTSMEGFSKLEDSHGQEDLWIIKLNAKGDEEWQRSFGGTGKEIIHEIKQTKDGGYIIGATTSSRPSGDKVSTHFGNLDYWIVKLDSEGMVEWERTYGGIYKDELQSISQTEDEGYIVGGYSNSPISGNKNEEGFGNGDYWILKLDKRGNQQWQRTIGGEQDDQLNTILPSIEGGYLLGGHSSSGATGRKSEPSKNGSDFWVLKLDDRGEIEWQQIYDFGETDLLTSLIENKDGTILIGGYAKTETRGLSKGNPKGINDYIALKINNEGEELWRQTVGSNGEDVLSKLLETRDGGYVLAGTSRSEISRDRNSRQGRSDFWVVKLKDKDKEDKERFPGLEAIPNPTDRFSNVIVNHEFDEGTAYVYDIAGRQLQQFKVKSNTIPVDLAGLPLGIYLVTVATDVQTQSVKILKGN